MTRALVASIALLLAGCASYAPRPINTVQMQQTRDNRRLDDAATRDVLARANLWSSSSRGWPPRSFTRGQLLAIAMANNPDVAESRLQLQRAIDGVQTARELPNPSFGLSFERDTQSGIEPPWLWGLTTNVALDGGIRRQQREALAQADVRAGRLAMTEASWAVRNQLTNGEIELAMARRTCALAGETETVALDWGRVFAERIAAGEDAAGDRLPAIQALNQARAATGLCRAAEQSARGKIARSLGMSLAAVQDLMVDWQGWDEPMMPAPGLVAARARQARSARPDLAAALVAYDTRELELAQQVHAQYPQVSIGPGYVYDHGIRKLTLGLSASLPILEQNQGPIAEARAQREAAGKHAESVQADVDNDIATAQATVQSNLASWHLAHQATLAVGRDADRVAASVRLGAADRVANVTARLSSLAARRTELDALMAARQSLAMLETALRSPVDGDEVPLGTPMNGTLK